MCLQTLQSRGDSDCKGKCPMCRFTGKDRNTWHKALNANEERNFKANIKFNHVCNGKCGHKKQKLDKDAKDTPFNFQATDGLKTSLTDLFFEDNIFGENLNYNNQFDDVFNPQFDLIQPRRDDLEDR